MNISSFRISLASTVSPLICLEIVKAHIYFHRELHHDKENAKILAKTCTTCNKSSHCLPWCSCHGGFCQCDGRDKFALAGIVIKCRNNSFSSSSSLKQCHCLTSDSNAGKVYVGYRVYTCGNDLPGEPLNEFYHPLPYNLTNISSYLCARFGRNGWMCGYCKDGLSPYVLS